MATLGSLSNNPGPVNIVGNSANSKPGPEKDESTTVLLNKNKSYSSNTDASPNPDANFLWAILVLRNHRSQHIIIGVVIFL